MRVLALLLLFPILAIAAPYTPDVEIRVPVGQSVKVTKRATNTSKDVLVTVNKGSAVTVTEVPVLPPPPIVVPPVTPSDFDTRKTAPGVVRWFDFDAVPQMGGKWGDNVGVIPGDNAQPSIDATVKSSGAGALRFDIPSQSNPNAGGNWFGNFAPDLQSRFGANSEFYVQVRTRWNATLTNFAFNSPGGTKLFDVTAQDGGPGGLISSSSDVKVVVQTLGHGAQSFPIVYRYDRGQTSNLWEDGGNYQNAVSGCHYPPTPENTAGCFRVIPDEWMTWELGVTLGPLVVVDNWIYWSASRVRLWGARDGKVPTLLVDWKPGVNQYVPLWAYDGQQQYGKVWLFPYMTSKDPTQAHPPGAAWYDDLIIGAKPIPFPGGFAPANDPVVTPPPGPLNTMKSGEVRDLGALACTDNGEGGGRCRILTDYSGMRYDAKRNRMLLFGGGHASTNYDGIVALNLGPLTWSEEYAPTPLAAMTPDNFDADLGAWKVGPSGPYPRPAARHSVDMLELAADDLLVLHGIEGNGPGLPGWTTAQCAAGDLTHCLTGGRVAHYSLSGKGWSFGPGALGNWPGSAVDPQSGKVLILGGDCFCVYDPSAKTMTRVVDIANEYWITDEAGAHVWGGELSYNVPLVYSAVDDAFYYFAPANDGYQFPPRVFRLKFDRSNARASTLTKIATTGIPAMRITQAAYDPGNKIIGAGPFGGTFYAFNPLTKAWASKPVPGDLAWMALDFDTADGVFVFVTDHGATGYGKAFAVKW